LKQKVDYIPTALQWWLYFVTLGGSQRK